MKIVFVRLCISEDEDPACLGVHGALLPIFF